VFNILQVLFTCLKRNDKREIKVAQLAGSVAEHSSYHHGEQSLMSTIVNLAQNFVGSNNINLLQPIGQFGTRLSGGKDSASPRYIFTLLRWAVIVFNGMVVILTVTFVSWWVCTGFVWLRIQTSVRLLTWQ